MSKLFTGSIDVSKIIKDKLYKGEKGTYLNVKIWLNDSPDKFGNIMSIEQSSDQGEARNYIGNAKEYVKKEVTQKSSNELPWE